MEKTQTAVSNFEDKAIGLLRDHSTSILRISIGLIYLIFGLLKFVPAYSPAEDLAGDTIAMMTFGFLPVSVSLLLLAGLESLIGTYLILNIRMRATVYMALGHMFCTFLPLALLPGYAFTDSPVSLSLVGQYIFKNIIIVSALLVVYANLKLAKER